MTLLSVQRQRSGSRSNVAGDIGSSACRVQQRAIILRFSAKEDNYQSENYVCVSVIRRLIQIISGA